MDFFDAQKARVHDAVEREFATLEQLYRKSLSNEISEHNGAHAGERRRYTEEIENLRKEAATAKELAEENTTLRAELLGTKAQRTTRPAVNLDESAEQSEEGRAAPFPREDVSTVSIDKYESLKQELANSTRDYGKLLLAYNIVETKYRDYKDKIGRWWRANHKDWVLRHPERESKLPSQDDLKPAQTMNAHGHRAANTLTPPAFPEGITPSFSNLSRSTSPQQQGYSPSKYTPVGLDNLLGHQSKGSKTPRDEIRSKQTERDCNPSITSDDLTQSSDGSDTLDKPRSQDARPDEKTLPPLSATHSDSSPIIISERSLKRKRGTRDTGKGIDLHGAARNASDVSKSPRVKDEIISSSPLPIDFLSGRREPSESIDLDDVGDQLTTPRKRQRMELQQLRSTIIAPSTVGERDEALLNTPKRSQHIEARLVDVEDEFAYQASGKTLLLNRETATDDQVIRRRDDNQEAIWKDEKRALFKAHNDRVIGRRDSAERSPSGSTPLGANYGNPTESACTPESPSLHGLLTPATNGRTKIFAPQDRRDGEERKAEIADSLRLWSTDTNSNNLPRTSSGLAAYKQLCPPSRRDRGAAAVPALAEDGEDPAVSGRKIWPEKGSKKEPRVSDAHHRLDALLSNHPTIKAVPPQPLLKERDNARTAAFFRTPLSRVEQQHRLPDTPATMPYKKRISLGTLTSMNPPMTEGIRPPSDPPKMPFAKSPFHKPSKLDRSPDMQSEQGPLRSRSPHRLRLEDFKHNPAHSDFAYHDPIRKHDEKKALSGCTKPQCPRCKDLRKFIDNSNYATLSLHQDHNDEKENTKTLIADYFGGDIQRLENLTEKERKDILADARFKQFADKFGKHRTSYARARSPVGFWDVNFPSTQEDERNKETARRRKKEMVEERYREAIRKGGRWVFADDS